MPRYNAASNDEDGLTPKEKAFCHEYIIDFNGYHALIRAGYAKKSAHVQATRLLKRPRVQSYLSKLLKERRDASEITANRVLEEFASIAFYQITDTIELKENKLKIKDSSEWSKDSRRAIESIKNIKDGEISIKAHNKIAALRALGEKLGLFNGVDVHLRGLQQYFPIEKTEDGLLIRTPSNFVLDEDGKFSDDPAIDGTPDPESDK